MAGRNTSKLNTGASSFAQTVADEAPVAIEKKTKTELQDTDEIAVVSMIPNVSYKDSRTGDFYIWDKVDHCEYMTFEVLKNMWRNSKGYFKNMWLKPLDDRVINKFGLESIFKNYEFLMDASNYTRANINKVCDVISSTPNELKYSIFNKIKDLVVSGEIVDIHVIRFLEKRLDLDLTVFVE